MNEDDLKTEFRKLLQTIERSLNEHQAERLAELYDIPHDLYGKHGKGLLFLLQGKKRIEYSNLDSFRDILKHVNANNEAKLVIDFEEKKLGRTITRRRASSQESLQRGQPQTRAVIKGFSELKFTKVSKLPYIKWLLIATEDIEVLALLTVFSEKDMMCRYIVGRRYWVFQELEVAIIQCRNVQTGRHENGSQEMLLVSQLEINPDHVVSVGLAYGMSQNAGLGDILLSRKLHSYVYDDGIKSVTQTEPHGDLLRLFTDRTGDLENCDSSFRKGDILSGPVDRSDSNFVAELSKRFPEAFGCEFGGDLINSLTRITSYQNRMVVRTVAGFIEDRSFEKDRKDIAAVSSAKFVLDVIVKSRSTGIKRKRTSKRHKFPAKISEFVERSDCEEIEAFIHPPKDNSKDTEFFAIAGAPGLGKTELSLWFCERMSDHYDFILFTEGGQLESLPESLEDDSFDHGPSLKKYLWRHGKWLLIVDNFEEPSIQELRLHVPEKGGVVIITTRNLNLLANPKTLEISAFTSKDTQQLFKMIMGKELDLSQMSSIGDLFDFNPYAIYMCAWYIYELHLPDHENIVEVVREHLPIILKKEGRKGKISFENLFRNLLEWFEEQNPNSRAIMATMSLLSRSGCCLEAIRGFVLPDFEKTILQGELGKMAKYCLVVVRDTRYVLQSIIRSVIVERMSLTDRRKISTTLVKKLEKIWCMHDKEVDTYLRQEKGEHLEALCSVSKSLSRYWRGKLVTMLEDYARYALVHIEDPSAAERRLQQGEDVEKIGCPPNAKNLLKNLRSDILLKKHGLNGAIAILEGEEKKTTDDIEKTYFLSKIADWYMESNQFDNALEYFWKANRQLNGNQSNLDLKEMKSQINLEIGYCHSMLGSPDKASRFLSISLKLKKKTDSPGEERRHRCRMYYNAAMFYFPNSMELAMECLEKSADIVAELDEHVDELDGFIARIAEAEGLDFNNDLHNHFEEKAKSIVEKLRRCEGR